MDALRVASAALPDGHPDLGYCKNPSVSLSLFLRFPHWGYVSDLQVVAECHRLSGAIDQCIAFLAKAIEIFSHHLPSQATSLSAGMFHLRISVSHRHRCTLHELTYWENNLIAFCSRSQASPRTGVWCQGTQSQSGGAAKGKYRHHETILAGNSSEHCRVLVCYCCCDCVCVQWFHVMHGVSVRIALVALGSILCMKGDFNEAVAHLQSGMSILRETLPSSPFIAEGTNALHCCSYLYFCFLLTQ